MSDPALPTLTSEQRIAALETLKAQGLCFSEIVPLYGESADDNRYVAYARENLTREGEIEVDDPAVVSDGDDKGCYILAWVWVSDEDIGVTDDA